MIAVSCKEELIIDRFEFLRSRMSSDARVSIFLVSNWMQPWGFGRENEAIATKLYNEFMDIQTLDTVRSIKESEYTDEVIMALHSQNEFGIIYVAEDQGMANEYIEDIINYLIIKDSKVPIKDTKISINTRSIPEPKKLDNLVIPRMHLFK